MKPAGKPEPGPGPNETAVGAVLSEIASSMCTVVTLAREALNQDPDTQAATLDALASMASSIGQLADRAARTLNGGHGLQSDDEWLLAPSVRDALDLLEGRK